MSIGPAPTKSGPTTRQAGSSLTVARIAGIPVRIHWTFPLLLALVAIGDEPTGTRATLEGLAWVLALFVCVVAHEVAHCVVARHHGATVRGIVLFPLGGMSQLESMPTGWSDEFRIAAIGPLTSIAIGGAFGAIAFVVGSRAWPPTLFAGPWLVRLAWLNLLLGTFNLLPAIPMDGGRMLRAALERRRPRLDATVLACRVATWISIALIVVGLGYDFWLALIGIFVLVGSRAEEAVARATAESEARSACRDDSHTPPHPS